MNQTAESMCAITHWSHTRSLVPRQTPCSAPCCCAGDCGWAAVFVGYCGSETRSPVMDRRPRRRQSDLEPHRGRGQRAGGPFCCERSESPAGGAALTICQRSLTLFSLPLLIQRRKKAARQKASQGHSDTADLPSMPLALSAYSFLFFFKAENIHKRSFKTS